MKIKKLDRKIAMIIPPIIADYHDNFIEEYLHTLESDFLFKN